MPDRTQEIKNLRAVAVASKNYIDKRIDDLEWQMGTYNYDVDTDSNVSRIKTLPSDTYKSMANYIGGKSVKYNQLVQNGNFDNTSNWSIVNAQNFSVSNNVASFTATAQYGNLGISNNSTYTIAGHKYLAIVSIKLTTATTEVALGVNQGNSITYTTATTSWQTLTKIYTATNSTGTNVLSIVDRRSSDWDAIQVSKVELIDLTDKFGAGNEPSTVETAIPLLKANGYKLDGTDEYSTSSLKHAITTSVVYSGTDVQDITLPIPSEVLALDGYGWGVNDTCYNYIDFNAKKFIKVVGRVDLGSLNYTVNANYGFYTTNGIDDLKQVENNETANMICTKFVADTFNNLYSAGTSGNYMAVTSNKRIAFSSTLTDATAFKNAMSGVYLYYELKTPVETDISQYLTTDFKVDLDKLYATCEMVLDEPIDMPNSITNLIKEVKA